MAVLLFWPYHGDMTRLNGIVGLLVALGCGGGSSPGGGGAISSQALSGTIGGKAWTLGTAESNAFLSEDDTFWVDAYAESFTPCTHATSLDTDNLILTLPKAPGTYGLSLALTQTFYIAAGSKNLAATSGTIVIESVTATTISGAAKFAFNADNSVDGTFQATICP